MSQFKSTRNWVLRGWLAFDHSKNNLKKQRYSVEHLHMPKLVFHHLYLGGKVREATESAWWMETQRATPLEATFNGGRIKVEKLVL